ncbi:glycosyltransferase [Carboxylicivirga caseinilyticus]|uniref:glycosyltransferase n=1 Tax=Carboxylicivirga caseinilyticus TaxID=3417572 RepID=UPI003D346BC4|nr:glycosyltransferase [Marinilabiliaceae bacterium A049]
MLSICIPVYNVDVRTLVIRLIDQANKENIEVEICIFDDGSLDIFKVKNRSLADLQSVNYVELKKNLGSAAIRNELAHKARFDNLLFIDSDSGIPDDYLNKYKYFFETDYSIICGGRIHPSSLPDPDLSLRWKVGRYREDFSALQRNKVPNKSFMSNNFLIKRAIFNIVKFNDKIERSGHEDTMFGIELERNKIVIEHIDNAVIHLGLENNDEFITKSEQRLETLILLKNYHSNDSLMFKRIKVLRIFKLIEALKLKSLISVIFKITKPRIIIQLKKHNPNLFLYDFYKLGYLVNRLK